MRREFGSGGGRKGTHSLSEMVVKFNGQVFGIMIPAVVHFEVDFLGSRSIIFIPDYTVALLL